MIRNAVGRSVAVARAKTAPEGRPLEGGKWLRFVTTAGAIFAPRVMSITAAIQFFT